MTHIYTFFAHLDDLVVTGPTRTNNNYIRIVLINDDKENSKVNRNMSVEARDILKANDRGGYTIPAGGMYPYQWNWDSVFVALGFATFDEMRACEEIETLFEAQWEDGFLPHIVFRRDDPDYFPGPNVWQAGSDLPTSGITQPPVAASIVNTLWFSANDIEVKNRLAALFPKILAWHRWFHKYRITEASGAVLITHPWESGRDNSPEWDQPTASIDVSGVEPYLRRDLQHATADMRPTKYDYDRYIALVEFGRRTGWNHEKIANEGPFRVADVGITMILLRATRDLIELARKLGHDEVLEELNANCVQLERGTNYLWDEEVGTYCSRDIISDVHSGMITNSSFLYHYAGVGSDAQRARMAAHWERISTTARYMMPSHDPGNSYFDHLRYWRGPIWIVVNYMLTKGFEENGLQEWAERVRTDSQVLIRESGFNEAFSPVSGMGSGGNGFSWTAAMWLAWCGDTQSATQNKG